VPLSWADSARSLPRSRDRLLQTPMSSTLSARRLGEVPVPQGHPKVLVTEASLISRIGRPFIASLGTRVRRKRVERQLVANFGFSLARRRPGTSSFARNWPSGFRKAGTDPSPRRPIRGSTDTESLPAPHETVCERLTNVLRVPSGNVLDQSPPTARKRIENAASLYRRSSDNYCAQR
jgi:hypothetical protein